MIVCFVIVALIVGMMIGYLVGKKQGFSRGYWAYELWNVDVIEDSLPEKTSRNNLAMKLQDEVASYVFVEDGKVKLKVVKSIQENTEEENPIVEYVEVATDVHDEVPAEASQE